MQSVISQSAMLRSIYNDCLQLAQDRFYRDLRHGVTYLHAVADYDNACNEAKQAFSEGLALATN